MLTLARPRALNALTDVMVADLARLLDQVSADPVIRVLVISGEGRGFCAGFDLSLQQRGRRPTHAGGDGDRARHGQ